MLWDGLRFAISPKKPPSDNYSHIGFFTVLLKCVPENGILPLLDSCLELWQNSQSARTMASMRPSTRTKKRPDKLAKVSSELWLWRPLFPKRDEGARHWLSSYHHLAWKKTKHLYPPVIVCRIWWWLVTAPSSFIYLQSCQLAGLPQTQDGFVNIVFDIWPLGCGNAVSSPRIQVPVEAGPSRCSYSVTRKPIVDKMKTSVSMIFTLVHFFKQENKIGHHI